MWMRPLGDIISLFIFSHCPNPFSLSLTHTYIHTKACISCYSPHFVHTLACEHTYISVGLCQLSLSLWPPNSHHNINLFQHSSFFFKFLYANYIILGVGYLLYDLIGIPLKPSFGGVSNCTLSECVLYAYMFSKNSL